MKQILNILLFLLYSSVSAQVGVNTTTPNAALEVNSSTQGVLVSRVALISKTVAAPVVNPQGGALANGTLVFNTTTAGTSPNNVVPGFYYWDTPSLKWIAIASDVNTRSWLLNGNTSTNPATDFLGTTDAVDLILKTNNTQRLKIENAVSPTTGTSGDILIGNTTNGTLKASKELILRQDGDVFGSSILRLRSRNAENGVIYETNGPAKLVDFIFRTDPAPTALNSSNIRFETRPSFLMMPGSLSEWQFGQPPGVNGGPTLVIGANGTSGVTSNSYFRLGNVGIGVAAPAQKLDIQGGNARINNAFIGDVGYGSTMTGFSHYSQANITGYGFLQTSDGNYTLINKANTGAGYLGFRIGNADKAVILNNGNVGIGITTPGALFQVYNSGTGTSCYTDGINYYTSSDARLKTAISPLSKYGLKTIMQLKPVTYTFKADQTNQPQVGFLAQEVQKIIPELVSGKEGDSAKGETLGIAYANLVPILTKAIQEQQATIEELKKKIEALEQKANK